VRLDKRIPILSGLQDRRARAKRVATNRSRRARSAARRRRVGRDIFSCQQIESSNELSLQVSAM
jgi:hypothetical protein